MQLLTTSIRKSLNPAFLKLKPSREEIELFKQELIQLLDRINEKESEEHHKNQVIEFLNAVYYKNNHYINTKGKSDLVIHNGKEPNSPVGVLIEAKKPSNKAEMISKDNINVKSFQELVLYYLRERKTQKNFKLRYLVVTNIYEWYIFDAQTFEKLFYENKELVSNFVEFEAGKLSSKNTDFFYKEIAAPAIQKVKQDINCTCFNLADFQKPLQNADKADDRLLVQLYKVFSPTHLLKLPFANDSNTLNKDFYAELLHIIGLEETKEGGKSIIDRKKASARDAGSLIENAMNKIDAMDKLEYVHRVFAPGTTVEDKLFNVSLDLSITWVNRILFLKLLEAQLAKYHSGDKTYRFLTTEHIKSFDDLDELFFQVLARKASERKGEAKTKYAHVPYLNSSLFEPTELEQTTITIGNLQDSKPVKLYAKSVLKSKKDKVNFSELSPIEYLFRFLDAYDFSSESSEGIQEENKMLISASVLGLIFEKINGYKDGSFFTPSFITMYMCHETLSRTVIQRFNEVKGWNCESLVDLHNKVENIAEANTIINSIRLCDPAVGSGHFLVSALNEMIALKSELGVLCDRQGKKLKGYKVTVVNDELTVSENDEDFFSYTPGNHESQRIQETLFHEKQTIIENSLFGVDLNPNSVKICQLRLWIELLKNAYYKAGTTELETLPNIDINIKCGNSLISRFGLDEGLSAALKAGGYTVEQYRNAVNRYRNAESKDEKREMHRLVETIKRSLKTEISKHDKNSVNLLKLQKELILLESPSLFERTAKEEKVFQKEIAQKKTELAKLEKIIDEIKHNKVYENAIEWRLEFPEVLNDNGDFEGFHAIIGNPPYIQLQKLGEMADAYQQMNFETYERTGDIYCLFYELGNRLLKENYYLSYITSNKWMRAGYGEKTRKYFVEKTNPQVLIDFSGQSIFDEATVDVNILLFNKAPYAGATQSCVVKESCIENMSGYLHLNSTINSYNSNSWIVLTDIESRIKEKIEKIGTPLKDWDIQINYGIKTGFNDAFIIDGAKRQELIEKHPKSEEIIRPILRGRDIKRYGYEDNDLWLIYIPWHFPLQDNSTITGASEIAELEFQKRFPAIYNHLSMYKNELSNRNKAETGIRYEWYALQRWGSNYWSEFFAPKIIYPNMTKFLPFMYDNEKYLTNQKCFIISGDSIEFLTAFLNSSLFKYCFIESFPELQGGTRELSKIFFDKIPVLKVDDNVNDAFKDLILKIQSLKKMKIETIEYEMKIDDMIFDLYSLSEEERKIIGFIEIK